MTLQAFGALVRERRQQLEMTLRELSEKSGIDPANLSRMQRNRLAAPQNEAVLYRLAAALEFDEDERWELIDAAYAANGVIPPDLVENQRVMEQLPLLYRALRTNSMPDLQQLTSIKEVLEKG